MILDRLKELEKSDNWVPQELSTIEPIELLDEIKEQYDSLIPIDYVLYSNIPTTVYAIVTEETESGELTPLASNPFYERLLIQLLYMQSKGLDKLYNKAVVATMAPAQASFYFEGILKQEEEYNFLWDEYKRYSTNTISKYVTKTNVLEGMNSISREEFEEALNKIKEIVSSGDE